MKITTVLVLLALASCNLPKLDQVSDKVSETSGVVTQIGQAVQRQIDMVRSADTNKDGKVSWQEMLAILAGVGGIGAGAVASRRSAVAQAQVDELYDATHEPKA